MTGVLFRISAVLLLHGAVFWVLLQWTATPHRDAAPVLVDLLADLAPLQPSPVQEPAARTVVPTPSSVDRRPARPVDVPAVVPRIEQPAAPVLQFAEVSSGVAVDTQEIAGTAVNAPASAVTTQTASVNVTPAPLLPPRYDAAYLNNPPPVYPAAARRRGDQGRVQLRVLVSKSGLAERVNLHQSSGSAALDQAAREAVERWRFVPARRGHETLSDWVIVPVVFSLNG